MDQWSSALRRVAGARECGTGPIDTCRCDRKHFPVEADGREIVTKKGVMIAVATDPADSGRSPVGLNKAIGATKKSMGAVTAGGR